MSSLNQCNFIGRLGKDPEVRSTPAGAKVCNITLAVSEKYNGEDKTEWVNVVLWKRQAEIAEQYLRKGSLIYLSGKMSTSSYGDKDGNKRYKTEIIGFSFQMLGSKGDNQGQQGGQQQAPAQTGYDTTPFGAVPNPSDDLPF